MNRIILLLFFFLVCNIAGAQTPKEDSIKTEIIKLSQQWNQALVKRDSITLDRILSKDFTLSSASGSTVHRKTSPGRRLLGLTGARAPERRSVEKSTSRPHPPRSHHRPETRCRGRVPSGFCFVRWRRGQALSR